MKMTEDVRKYAAEQSVAEAETIAKRVPEKSKDVAQAGAEIYAKT
jgi:phosphomethylpyrimidine synthase